ncbi:MAG: thioredoxin-like domain-containing protein, partial [Gemmatimonadaceae bacterium]
MHVLPQLRELEQRFAREVAVVGVHSGKYITERETSRIREAALRLGNTHPIVNDRQFRVWRSYAVRAWPTLVVVDPSGYVLGSHAGEFTADEIAPVLARVIAANERSGALVRQKRHVPPDEPAVRPGALRYPGSVEVDGDRIAIADSGHHRVLIGRLTDDGARVRLELSVGGERGFENGPGAGARFDFPQGMAFHDDTLYVADAGNHAIRAVDTRTGHVRTVAGTGAQLRTRADLRAGALSSPWDVAVPGDRLFIAMAGTHQIWSLELPEGRPRVHSGSGHEDIVDGPHDDAALAQPMGLAPRGDRLYFVDAESSAVRWTDISRDDSVGTVIGTGLFDFGDRDGTGDEVRMQHQQGIALHSSGRLLVADSYNDALKWVNPETRVAETWVRGLHEPGGIACGTHHAYVADTNAHRVARVGWETGVIEGVEVG